jgi:chromosome segregation ATPase
MSLAVKILTILNLVLAFVVATFCMIDYATGENWKRRWNTDTSKLSEQLVESNKGLTEATFDKARFEAAASAANGRISELTAQVNGIQSQISEKTGEISRLSQENTQKSQELTSLREANQSMTSSLELARQNASEKTQIAQVARAAAFQLNNKLAEVEDDLHNERTKLAKVEEDTAKLVKDTQRYQAQLAVLKDRYPKVWAEIADAQQAAALVQGLVATVSNDAQGKQSLVILTVGKNDKVEEGTEFTVFRGNKYIVKVRAERVLPDMVSCRVIAESWNKDGIEIQQGDSAQNRL